MKNGLYLCKVLLLTYAAVFHIGMICAATTPSATSSVSLKVTPAGAGKLLPSKTIYFPCNGGAEADQLTIAITGKNSTPNDLYFFIVNTTASGSTNANLRDNQFYVFKRYDYFNINVAPPGKLPGVELFLRATSASLDKTQVLLRAEDYAKLGTNINEVILQGAFLMNGWGFSQGVYVAVAILADRNLINFDDPSTWIAWDSVPFILNSPWRTNNFLSIGAPYDISSPNSIQLGNPNTCD